eukprot:bmy_06184T0
MSREQRKNSVQFSLSPLSQRSPVTLPLTCQVSPYTPHPFSCETQLALHVQAEVPALRGHCRTLLPRLLRQKPHHNLGVMGKAIPFGEVHLTALT